MNADLMRAFANVPLLDDDAPCKGSDMWDEARPDELPADVGYRLVAAARRCREDCGSLALCRTWFQSLDPADPYRPSGVVAGMLIGTGLRGAAPKWSRSA